MNEILNEVQETPTYFYALIFYDKDGLKQKMTTSSWDILPALQDAKSILGAQKIVSIEQLENIKLQIKKE